MNHFVSAVLTAAMATLAATAAHAAMPSASIAASSAPVTFAEYSGTATLGQGLVDQDTLYYVNEKTGPAGKSWYVFFDPAKVATINATITFDAPIVAVYTTKAELDSSNATYGANGVHYGTSLFIGLDKRDTFSFTGNKLNIDWSSADPGDSIRVITQASPVPEATTGALLAGGLLAVAFIAWRRSGD